MDHASIGIREYRTLRNRKMDLVFCHCRACMSSKPEDMSMADWSRLEAFIDMKTGLLTVGCRRCELPVVSASVDLEVLQSLIGCGCETCRKESQH